MTGRCPIRALGRIRDLRPERGTVTVGATKLVVLESGNVGIGTALPAYKLHISSGDVRVDGTGTNRMTLDVSASGTAYTGTAQGTLHILNWDSTDDDVYG